MIFLGTESRTEHQPMSAHDNLTLYDKLEAANKGKSKEVLKDMAKLANNYRPRTSQVLFPSCRCGVFKNQVSRTHNSYRSSDKVNAPELFEIQKH